jgi:hypothetical protein
MDIDRVRLRLAGATAPIIGAARSMSISMSMSLGEEGGDSNSDTAERREDDDDDDDDDDDPCASCVGSVCASSLIYE